MNLLINNPWGFLALLGLPAVLLIHFFQRRAKVIPLSTLFLLEQTQRESISGRRFERLTNSVPLWMQLLAVLLLTWILIEPRYKKADSTQQVALVIDSSASMQAVKEKLLTTLEKKIPEYQGNAKRLDLYLFDSNPNRPPLYAGTEIDDALKALEDWTPYAGASDPILSLQLARSRVRRDGIVTFVTDTPVKDLPFNAACLSIGEKKDNCGLTGVSFEERDGQLIWRALIRNYSDRPQVRTWTMTDGTKENGPQSQPRSIDIKANGIASIQGPFPEKTDRLTIRLQADALPLDDILPLVRPQPKQLIIENTATDKYLPIGNKLISSFTNTIEATGNSAAENVEGKPSVPDITFTSYDPLLPILPETNAIVAVDETTQSSRYLRGGIVAEKHPLMDGLNWQPLLIREALEIERTTADEVLLWQGDRPLIFLRSIQPAATADGEAVSLTKLQQQLIFNFDLTLSNALKLPATVVILHRFTNSLRAQKIAPESLNTETGQPLTLSYDRSEGAPDLIYTSYQPDGSPLENLKLPLDQITELRAPIEPAFYTIKQADNTLLTASAYFADTREADLRNCATAEIASFSTDSGAGSKAQTKAIEKHSFEDHLWRLWALLLLTALLISWAWHNRKQQPEEEYA